jgi:hypothetical protein
MYFQNSELAFHEQNARFNFRYRLQRQVNYSLDRKPGCHLNDQRMLTTVRRVTTGSRRRAHVSSELLLELFNKQVDA